MSKNNLIKFLLVAICLSLQMPVFAQEEYVYDSKGKRDPFMPLITSDGVLVKLDDEETGENPLVIEGIIYDRQGLSYAIVDGQVVKPGNTLSGGVRVFKIENNKVIFTKEGQPMEVILSQDQKEEGQNVK